MNTRNLILDEIYDIYSDKGLFNEIFYKSFNEISEEIYELTGSLEKQDDINGKLCDINRLAFMDGANAVLDLISGKELKA